MANEELFKRLTEAAKKAAEGTSTARPVEQSPTPETPSSAPPATTPEMPQEGTTVLPETHDVSPERFAALVGKLAETTSEATKRIIGSEHDLPKDARVFSIVESLLTADEAQLANPEYMRGVAEQLVQVAKDAEFTSPTAVEARKFLRKIVAEHPSLERLQYEAMPVIQGGSGVDENTSAQDENAVDADPELSSEVKGLYDEATDTELLDTPIANDLKDLQYRFRVDPGAAYDGRLTDDAVRRIVEKGRKEGVNEKLVQQAVERIRHFERFTDLRMQKHQEKLRGGRVVTWGEVMGNAPNPELHRPDEVFPDFRYIPPSDVEMLIQGDEGEARWYFDFIDQIYSMGREETRPTLTQDQRFQEFKDFLVWKYGSEYHLAVQLYQKHWDSRGQYEYAVKGLMYNPGDVKDRLKAMSLLQGADLDHLYKNFDHSNEAYSLYEHVLFELMATKRAKYGEAIKYLREDITWNGKTMKREDILKELKAKQRQEGFDPEKGKTQSPLSVEDQRLMHEIQQQMDLAAEGVMLWDDDVQSYTELHITLSKLRNTREQLLKKKSEGVALNEKEMEQLSEVERLYQIYSHREEMLNENFTQELLETRGLSPVDIEVRKRLVEYLKAQHPDDPNYKPAEYEVRMALWASRTAMIGSGRMAMIGAMMSVPPAVEYGTSSGKHVMRAPAFEDIQRIFNPETFATRFNIGGDMGITARSIFRKNLLRTKGINPKEPNWYKKISGAAESLGHKFKLTKTKEWHEAKHHEHDKERQKSMETWEFAEDATGISFSELLGPGFMASGGFYDGTAWRLEKGVADELRGKMLSLKKLPENAALLDNQALSIQLLTAGNAGERRPILDRMLRRNPSKFLELLEEDTERILTKNNITHEEWKKFKEALSLAELKMAHEKEWQFARIDLAEKKDFDALVAPYLKILNLDPARNESMRQIIVDMQAEIYRSRPVEASGTNFRNKMDAIAALKLPLTMSLTDFDWKETNFYQLGTVAMHRRIRDVGAQMRARDGLMEFFSNSEMVLSPNDYTKSLQKMMEVRTAIVDYSGPDAAEATVKEMMRVFFEMNKGRHLSMQLIPGLVGLLQHVEPDFRGLENNKILQAIFGKERWRHLAKEKIAHWPHSIAEAVSYSTRYTGSHGNVWDEVKMSEIIHTAHDMGLFINHPEYLQDLQKEFRTLPIDRLWAMARKYWWVPILATLAIAAEKSLEEQKGGGGGGGH